MTYQLASREAPGPPSPDEQPGTASAFGSLIGDSAEFVEVVEFARKVAARRLTTALVVGETGTGKGLFARGIHYSSPAADQPFVPVNCAAIPSSLLESELFGHERGAFTDAKTLKRGLIELAGAGTLFLDEISELPPNLQPKLLRALEERCFRRVGGVDEIEVRCRVIAATNVALEDAMVKGRFREDLFYRLNVLRISIPPLRERPGDMELLARHFLDEFSREQGLERKTLTADAVDALRGHGWPGNVRELKNVVQRAAVVSEASRIRARDLTIHHRHPAGARHRSQSEEAWAIWVPATGRSMESIEEEALRLTLESTGGNQSAAARLLGLSRATVVRKIAAYGIDPEQPLPKEAGP